MWAWAEELAWQLREGRLLPPEEAQGHVPTALWLSLDGLESLLSSSEALAAALGGTREQSCSAGTSRIS